MEFSLVCLFGFSMHFREVVDFCREQDIDCAIVTGERQIDEVCSLGLGGKAKILAINSLECEEYYSLGIGSRSSIGLSFGAPYIFTSAQIDEFSGGILNSHGTPLPEHRGGGAFSWRILMGDKRGKILMHSVVEEIDRGEVMFEYGFNFTDDHRHPRDYMVYQEELEKRYMLPWIKKSIVNGVKRESLGIRHEGSSCELGSSYFPRLHTDTHGIIDWMWDIENIERHILAFGDPYPGSTTYIRGDRVRIFSCVIERKLKVHPSMSGLVVEVTPRFVRVLCSGGVLRLCLEDIEFESTSFRIKEGERFWSPREKIERALSTRAFYRPEGLTLVDYRQRLEGSEKQATDSIDNRTQ